MNLKHNGMSHFYQFSGIARTTLALLFLTASTFTVKAADFYWVGGSGDWSDIANHWATTSGGTTFHVLVPTPLDDVHFDANSFGAGSDVVTITFEAFCKSFTADNMPAGVTFQFNAGINIEEDFSVDGDVNIYNHVGNFVVKGGDVTLDNSVYFYKNNGHFYVTGGDVFLGDDVHFDKRGWVQQTYIYNGTFYFTGSNARFYHYDGYLRCYDGGMNVTNTNYFYTSSHDGYFYGDLEVAAGGEIYMSRSTRMFDGGVSFDASATISQNANLNFQTTTTGAHDIKTGGHEMRRIQLDGSNHGSTYNLQDDLKCENEGIYIYANTFKSNGHAIDVGRFYSWTSGVCKIDLTGTSLVRVKREWRMYPSTNTTLIMDDADIEYYQNTHQYLYGGNKTYNDVTFNITNNGGYQIYLNYNNTFDNVVVNSYGSAYLRWYGNNTMANFTWNYLNDVNSQQTLGIYGSNTVTGTLDFNLSGNRPIIQMNGSNNIGTLDFDKPKQILLGAGSTQTVGTINPIIGTCDETILINSTSLNSTARLSQATGTVTADWALMQDNTAQGGATFNATNTVDLGNVNGWNITALTAVTYYWIGGSGNWNDPNHWSLSSGGATNGCAIPSRIDDVIFDANSFSGSGQYCNMNVVGDCHNMTWNGITSGARFIGSQQLHVYGDLTCDANMDWSKSGDVYFQATDAGNKITTNGIKLYQLRFTGQGVSTGEWILQDDLACHNYIFFERGNFKSNGKNLDIHSWYNWTGSVANIDFTGTSTIEIDYEWRIYPSTNITLNMGTATIHHKSYNHMYFYGGSKTYHDLHIEFLNTGNYYIRHEYHNTFRDVKITAPGSFYSDWYHNSTFRNFEAYQNGTGNTQQHFTWHGTNTFNDFTFKGNGNTKPYWRVYNNNTVNGTLILENLIRWEINAGRTQTINQGTITGDCNQWMELRSRSYNGQTNISVPTGNALTTNYVYLQDINSSGAGDIDAYNSADINNNTGNIVWNTTTPTNFYWVGGAGNWSDLNSWSYASGGTPGVTCLPSLLDNVFFDVNSFSSPGQNVNINVPAYCNNMVWDNVNFPTISGTTMYIYGSMILDKNLTWNNGNWIYMMATDQGNTIKTEGVQLYHIDFRSSYSGTGEWILQDDLDLRYDMWLRSGTLRSGGNEITLRSFFAWENRDMTLDLTGSSVFNLSHWWQWYPNNSNTLIMDDCDLNWDYEGHEFLSYFGSNETFNDITYNHTAANNHRIYHHYTNGSTFGNITMNLGGYQRVEFHQNILADDITINYTNPTNNIPTVYFYNTANLNTLSITSTGNAGPYVYLNQSNTFNDLIAAGVGTRLYLGANRVQTVNGLLSIGSGGFPVHVRSTTDGSTATLYKPDGEVCLDFVLLKDVTATSVYGADVVDNTDFFAGAQSANLGNNSSNWNFSSCGAYYWVGGTGNWSDLSHWATSSGGSVNHTTLPGSGDDVYFDANSFNGANQVVTIDVAAPTAKNMTWQSALYTPTLTNASGMDNLYLYGSLKLIPSMNQNFTGDWNFMSNTSGNTVNSAGQPMTDVTFVGGNDGEGGWDLDNVLDVSGTIDFRNGSLDLDDWNVSTKNFNATTPNTRVLNLTSSEITITDGQWNPSDATNLTFDKGTSKIIVQGTSASNFYGNGLTYNDVTFTSTATLNSDVTGSNTFNTLRFEAGVTATIDAGSTQTAAQIESEGECTRNVVWKSSAIGNAYNFNQASGTTDVEFTAMSDNNGSGTATYDAALSTNNGGNTNWNFTSAAILTVSQETGLVDCITNNDGYAKVTPLTGTAPYSYLWSTLETTQQINGLLPGTYTVTVTDANGCTAVEDLDVINQPSALDPVDFSISDADVCIGTQQTFTADDISSTALDFDGSGDHVIVANNSAFETSSGTIEMWLNSAGSSDNEAFVAMRTSVSNTRYSFHVNEGANTIGIYNGAGFYTLSQNINVGQWYHIALVFNATTTTVYVDGSSIGTLPGINTSKTGMALSIGSPNDGSYPHEWFTGKLDDVRIWDDARTPSEILGLKDIPLYGSESNLVAYYNFEDGTGSSTASDKTANSFDGSLTNMDVNSDWVSPGGLNPSVTYEWDFDDFSSASTQTANHTYAAGGTYEVELKVRDAAGCPVTTTKTVQVGNIQQSVTKINVLCKGENNGSIDIVASGGVAPYEYSIDGGVNYVSTSSFNSLVPGTYQVKTRDAIGCETSTQNHTVTEPGTNVAFTVANIIDTECPGELTGGFTINATGGTPSYVYSINNGINYVPFNVITGQEAGTFTVKVRDANGCETGSQSVTVNQSDTEDPELTGCPTDMTVFTPSGSCLATVSWTAPTATDNCNNPTVTQITGGASGTSFAIGTHTITYEASDADGNTDQCQFTITVKDANPPTAVCQNITRTFTSGPINITAADIDGGSFDDCGAITLSASQTTFTAAHIGNNNVTLTVTDAGGNQSNCVAVVTIVDDTDPVAVCKDLTLNLDANGSATITASQLDNGSYDNSGSFALSASKTAFDCSDLNVTGNCSDFALDFDGIDDYSNLGNLNYISSGVNGEYSLEMWIHPRSIQSGIGSWLFGDERTTNNGVFVMLHSSGGLSLYGPTTSGHVITTNTVPLNSWTHVAVVQNSSGSKIYFNGSLVQSFTTVNVETSYPTYLAQFALGARNFDGQMDEIRVWNYARSATDIQNNYNTCLQGNEPGLQYYFDLEEGTGTTITDITSSVSANLTNMDVSDWVTGCSSLSGTSATQAVTLTVTDGAGNSDDCVAYVTVIDNVAPVANVTSLPTVTGECSATAIAPTATDNCAGSVTATTSDPLTYTAQGTYTITWIYEDNYGNTSQQTQTVVVDDQTAPVPDVTTLATATGECSASVTAPTATDACEGAITATTTDPTTYTAQGTYTVTWTYDDGNGNTSQQTQTVIVDDQTAPNAICQDITVQLDANGQATITAAQIDNGSNDACGIASMTVSPNTFDCDDVSLNSNNQALELDGNNSSSALINATNAQMGIQGTSFTAMAWINLDQYSGGDEAIISNDGCLLHLSLRGQKPYLGFCHNDIAGTTVINTNQWYHLAFVYNASTSTQSIYVNGVLDVSGGGHAPLNADGPIRIGSYGGSSGFDGEIDEVQFWNSALSQTTIQQYMNASPTGTETGLLGYWNFEEASGTTANDLTGNNNATLTGSATRSSNPAPTSGGGGVDVTLTVTDNNGNTSTCDATVTIEDNTNPTAVCNNLTIDLQNRNVYTLTQADIDFMANGSDDNCAFTYEITSGQTSFDCDDKGQSFTVTLTVTDASGNTASCNPVISITDNGSVCNDPPTAICQNITVSTPANACEVSIVATDVDGGSTDPDGDVLTYTLDNYGPFGVGTHTVTLTADDGEYQDQCNATVTVEDNVAPETICQDITVQLDASGNASITAQDIDNGSNDACGIASLSVSQTDFDCSHVGGGGAYLAFNNSNVFTNIPAANLPETNFTVEYWFNTTSANANLFEVNYSGHDRNMYLSGGTLRARLWSEQTISSNVSGLNDGNWHHVSWTVESGVGQRLYVDGNLVASGSKGESNFHWAARFYLGYTVYSSAHTGGMDEFRIWNKVLSTTEMNTYRNQILNGNETDLLVYYDFETTGSGSYTDKASSFDISSVGSTSIVPSGGGVQGGVGVTLTVTDNNGNTSTCEATVSVEDNVDPTAICQDITVQLDANGQASITANDIDNGSNDACGIASLSVSQTDFDCDDIGGSSTVTVVSDGNWSMSTYEVASNWGAWPYSSFAGSLPAANTYTVPVRNEWPYNGALVFTPAIPGTQPIEANRGHQFYRTTVNLSAIPTSLELQMTMDNFTEVLVNGHSLANMNNATGGHGFQGSVPHHVFIDANGVQNGYNGGDAFHTTTSQSLSNIFTTGVNEIVVVTTNANGTDEGGFVLRMDLGVPAGNPVTLTVTDNNGNTSKCDATVTVEDNIDPVALCQPYTVQLDASGHASITAANVDNGSNDACGIASMSVSQNTFTCANVGNNTVTLTVTDNNGNVSTCVTTVTVEDKVLPSVVCKDITIQLDANGQASIIAADIDGGSSDACGIAGIVASQTSFDCDDVGDNTVTLTVTDNNGNMSSCDATVTVEDNINPTITNCPANIVVNTIPGDCSSLVSWTPPTIDDNCGGLTLDMTTPNGGVIINNAIGLFPKGVNTVIATVTDASGNTASCQFTVTVEDHEPPTITGCPTSDIVVSAPTGKCESVVTWQPIIASDNCPGVGMVTTHTSGTTFPVGTTTVIYTATDASGNVNTCSFNVVVEDNEAPTVVTQNITVQLDASGNASIVAGDIENGSTDNCGIASYSVSPSSFTCSDAGPVTVTLSVTDIHGNTGTNTATVTVEDNVDPVALCKTHTVQLDANGNGSMTAADIDDGSNDACGIASLVASKTVFDCTNVGMNTVTLTVTDNNGNVSTCITTVTVEDKIDPVAVCKAFTVQLDDLGIGTMTASDINYGSNDACGVAGIVASKTSFDCTDVGPNTVTLTVTDNNGNSSTCTAIVTVEDNVAPIALCKTHTVQLDVNGNGSMTASDIDNGSNDACGIASLVASKTSFDCSNVGANTVTLTVTDNNGNVSTCTTTVTVEDNIDPVALCRTHTVQLDANGNGSMTASDIDNGSNDACGIAGISASETSFDCTNVGANTVTLTVTDNNGNVSTCTTTVTVEDNVDPNAICKDITVQLDANGEATIYPTQVDNGSNDACGVSSYQFQISTAASNLVTNGDFNSNASGWTQFRIDGNGGWRSSGGNPGGLFILNDNGNFSTDPTISQTITGLNVGQTYTITGDYRNYHGCCGAGAGRVAFGVDVDGNQVATFRDPGRVWTAFNVSFTATATNHTIAFRGEINGSDVDIAVDNLAINVPGSTTTLTSVDYDCSNVGDNTVTLLVTDVNGNSSTCTSTVTIEDNVDPIALCKTHTVQLDANGNGSMTASDIDNGSNDACGIASLVASKTSFDCSNVGANTVTLTVSDNNGNVSTCTTTVTVEDNIDPVALCRTHTVQLDANGNGSMTASDIDNGSNDACGIASLVASKTSFDCSNVGANTVTLTVTDNNGNVSTCTTTVTVEDNVDPVALCQSVTIQLDNNGEASITTGDIDNGSNDACGIASLALSKYDYTCSDLGSNTVTLTVTDNNGNVSTCSATVTVEDQVAPVISGMPANISVIADSSDCDPVITWTLPSVWDNCYVTMTSDYQSGDEFPVGTTTVTYTAVDQSGNRDVESFDIRVTPRPFEIASLTSPAYNGGWNISCHGEDDGSATVVMRGGCLPYTYSWSTNESTSTISNLTAGTYTVSITDANGTTVTGSITLTEPDELVITSLTHTNICAADLAAVPTAGYAYKKTITISSDMVSGSSDLSDFPVVLNLQDNDFKCTLYGGQLHSENGDDIMITNSACEPIPYQVERYNPATGEIVIWVLVDELNASGNTELNIVYSNEYESTSNTGTGVWANDYEATWHMSDGLSAGKLMFTDASGNGNEAKKYGSTHSNQFIDNIAGAFHFDGSNDLGLIHKYDLDSSLRVRDEVYVQAWVKIDDARRCNDQVVVAKGKNSNYRYASYYLGVDRGRRTSSGYGIELEGSIKTSNGYHKFSVAGINEDEWTLIGISYDGSAIKGYINGQEVYSKAWTGTIVDYHKDYLYMGRKLDGGLDEARVSSVARASNWIATEYNNQADPTRYFTVGSTSDNSCGEVCVGTAQVMAIGGTPAYTYTWSNGDNTPDADELCEGEYSITIVDQNGCTVSDEVDIEINRDEFVELDFDVTHVSCNGLTDGAIDMTISGREPNPDGKLMRDVYRNIKGRYVRDLTSSANYPASPDESMHVTAFEGPSNDGDKYGQRIYGWVKAPVTGAYTFIASGDDAFELWVSTTALEADKRKVAYSNRWTSYRNCNQYRTQKSQPINLVAGQYYYVEVLHKEYHGGDHVSVGWILPDNTTELPIGSSHITSAIPNSDQPVPLSITWSNSETTEDITGLEAGTYEVYVVTENGCTVREEVEVTEPDPLVAVGTPDHISCNGETDGSITASATGGTAPYTYSWTDASDESITEEVDVHSCVATGSDDAEERLSSGDVYTWGRSLDLGSKDYKCRPSDAQEVGIRFQDLDIPQGATITSAYIKFKAYYTSKSNSSLTFEGELAGDAATYNNGDYNITSRTVTTASVNWNNVPKWYSRNWYQSPDLSSIVQEIVDQQSWTAENAMAFMVSGTGHRAAYSYDGYRHGAPVLHITYKAASSSDEIDGLAAGTYTLTVTDANGCTDDVEVTITEPSALIASVSTVNVSCADMGGQTCTVNAYQANGPHHAVWMPHLPGCNSPRFFFEQNSGKLETFADGTAHLTGIIYNQPTGRSSTNRRWEVDLWLSNKMDWSQWSALGRKAKGPSNMVGANFKDWDYYIMDTTKPSTLKGLGYFSGKNLVLHHKPGDYTYGFQIGKAANDKNTNFGMSGWFTYSGSYTGYGDFNLDASCGSASSGCDGEAEVTVAGGTAPYTYYWSNGATGSKVENFCAGDHSVTITDANGCQTNVNFSISAPDPIQITLNTDAPNCYGATNGEIAAAVSGGTQPYTYIWSTGDGTSSIDNLGAGIYELTIVDGNGCTKSARVELTAPPAMILSVTTNDVSCNGGSDGSASVSIHGGSQPYTVTWSNNSTGTSTSDLSEGYHEVEVTDANGCTAGATFYIDEPDAISLSLNSPIYSNGYNVSSNGAQDGEIQVNVSGGNGPYTYEWTTSVENHDYVVAQVNNRYHDAEESKSGKMLLTSSDLELVKDGKYTQKVGVLFSHINIPQGAEIEEAYIQFAAEGTRRNSKTVSLNIYGHDADNSSSFSAKKYDISNRSLTSASVNWSPKKWTSRNQMAADQMTPDLKDVVQEIVDRGGWKKGNCMTFIITGQGTREAWSYDGNRNLAPELIIKYRTKVAGANPKNLGAGTYHLKVTDRNGCSQTASITLTEPNGGARAQQSDKQRLTREFDNDLTLEIGPNPVVNAATVTLDIEAGVSADIKVMDMAGRTLEVVYSGQVTTNGPLQVQTNLYGLRSGIYQLVATTSDGRQIIKRFVVAR